MNQQQDYQIITLADAYKAYNFKPGELYKPLDETNHVVNIVKGGANFYIVQYVDGSRIGQMGSATLRYRPAVR